ncbi:MAG: PadR family transcriptional regulator [Gemmatimonadota bacterium]
MDRPSFDSQSLGRRLNELLVLSLLRRAPMHGYQVAVEVEERSDGFFTFNHGTLYPILHRLETEGLIAGEWSDPAEGRARKAYALTEAGRTYRAEGLREWTMLVGRLSPFLDDEAANDKVSDGAA